MTIKTVNEILLDKHILHAVWLQGVQNSTADMVTIYLKEQIYPQIVKEIRNRLANTTARGHAATLGTNKRLVYLKDTIKSIIDEGYRKSQSDLVEELLKIAAMEVDFQVASMNKNSPINFSFAVPNKSIVSASILKQTFEGAILSDWWKSLNTSTSNDIIRGIQLGLKNGESIDDIVRRISGTPSTVGAFNKSKNNMRTIVRTAVNHATTQAREQVYIENKNVVKSVRWVSTLDSRTSLICIDLDGSTMPVGKGIRPPAHPNCRSTTVPVIEGWEKFGLKNPPASTRASMNGQVPDNITYPEWLKSQSPSTQNKVLGKAKAEAWRSGKIKVDKFLDDNHKPLTLDQIRKREGIEI